MGDRSSASDVAADRITRVLDAAAAGEAGAAEQLLPLVYEQLRALARQRMADERAGHTLQATALVHEAYLRLMGPAAGAPCWSGRAHFYCAAAEAMRRILVEHARSAGRLKRGGPQRRLSLHALASVDVVAAECDADDVIALDDAFQRLEQQNPDAGAVVRLRFFAGLSVAETAETLGVSDRTVNREWTYARAWLYRELSTARP